MGGSTTTLSIVLKLVDDASTAMTGVADKLKATGEAMMSQGKSLTMGVTLPIVGVATAVTKMASDYEDAMLKIQTGAGASAQEVSQLSKTFLDMAQNGAQQTPLQLAQGMYSIESAGFHANDALIVLKAAMDGANVGGVDLTTVSKQLATAMNATKTHAADAEKTMALLNATVGQGVMTLNDLIGAMSTGIIPKAISVGLSLNDVAAALDTMTQNGIPAQDAATRLGMTFSLLEAPVPKAIKALQSIGLTSTTLADEMRTRGLVPALNDLEAHLTSAGLTATQQAQKISAMFGGGRTSGAILLLLQHLGEMKGILDSLGAGAQSFAGYVQAQGETTAAYLARMKASAAAAGIEIGDAIAPLEAVIFPKLAAAISVVADWFAHLSPQMRTAALTVLAVAAAAGPLEFILGAMSVTVGFLLSPFGLLLIAVTAVALIFERFHTQIAAFFTDLDQKTGIVTFFKMQWDSVADTFMKNLWPALQKLWDALQPLMPFMKALAVVIGATLLGAIVLITGALTTAINLFTNLLTAATKVSTFFTNVFVVALKAVETAIEAIITAVSKVGSVGGPVGGVISSAMSSMLSMVPHFASGGIVNGPTMALVGEAGPEAIIPLSAFSGGSSLRGGGGGGNGNIVVNINGGNYLDSSGATMIADAIGKQIMRQLKLKNFS